MRIAGTEFNLKYNALEIYISGCKEHPCEGCHNPELWDFNVGEELDESVLDKIKSLVKDCGGLIKRIWVLGGEPLDNDISELYKFLSFLRNDLAVDEVWLWTRKRLPDIPITLLYHITHIKCGMYLKDREPVTFPEYDITLASNNQCIYKVEDIINALVDVNRKENS